MHKESKNVLGIIALVAILYYVAGKLALLLAVPPGYATAIWPSAGIALAFTIRYGYRIAIGVLIGSFCVNIGNGYNADSLVTVIISCGIAFAIASGAALQAMAGTYLSRRYVKSLELVNPSDILKFFFLGGFIASTISSTCGVTTLFLSGKITWVSATTSWLTWLVGDTVGVFLFAPLFFLWIGYPRDIWKIRRYYLAIPLIIVFVIVIIILNVGYKFEKKQLQSVFSDRVDDFTVALQYKINEFYMILDSLHGFYASSNFVSRDEFKSYVGNLILNVSHIKSIAWVPKVYNEERDKFIAVVREEGFKNYAIKDVSSGGKIVDHEQRDAYYPILYIEPFDDNVRALGVDNLSEARRKKALELALEEGKHGASAPLNLVQDKKIKSLLLVRPVFKKDTPLMTTEERKVNAEGFLTITTNVEDVIKGAFSISSSLKKIQFVIKDKTSNDSEDVYTHTPESRLLETDLNRVKKINIAGRVWEITFRPTVALYSELQSWTLWFSIVGVFLLATLLNILFLIVTGQTVQIKRIVDERTNALEQEIKKHKKTLKMVERRGALLESSRFAALNIMEDAQRAKKKAEEAEVASRQALNVKSEFTSMVSHELRTPLTVIKESVAIVHDETAGPISKDQKDFLETAKRNVDRLGRLINDVLDYQKIEAQQMEFRMEPGDINGVVREAGEGFRIPLKNKGVELVMKLAPDLPSLNFDWDKITQVLTNLISNAMKFTDSGQIVLMTQRDGNNAIRISVKDSGTGIKQEDFEKLFKSFSQISTGSSRQTGGTGLGLVLCKKIVEHHNGKISVDSEYGKGSEFYFILPIEDRRA